MGKGASDGPPLAKRKQPRRPRRPGSAAPPSRRASPPAAERSSSAVWTAVFIVLLALPRVLRMAWPQVWIEDESYLNAAFMLATGHAPYTGFALPHFPLLEGSLALLLKVFPASIRTAEAITQIAAFTASVFIWRIGRTLGGRWCGVAAAAVFAVSPVLFRYHVFEREVFVIVPVLGASWLALKPSPADRRAADRRAGVAGLLLAVALAVKLTAASYAGALFVCLLVEKRSRDAVVFAVTLAVLMTAAFVVLLAVFGMPFFVQVFLFRLVHAGFHWSLTEQLGEFLHSQDLGLALGLAGFVALILTRQMRRWLLPLLLLVTGFLLLVVLNPTYWAHDGVELLPWLALLAGALVAEAAAAWGRNPHASAGGHLSRGAAGALATSALALLVFVVPVDHSGWKPGERSGYGFGYRDRAEIDRVAAFVRARTRPDERVAVPPIVAFQANRPELIVYPELAGTLMTLEQEVRANGILMTWRTSNVGRRMFWDEVAASRDAWMPELAAAIQQRTVGAIIDFSPADLFPIALIGVPDATLRHYGYEPGLTTEHYVVWLSR